MKLTDHDLKDAYGAATDAAWRAQSQVQSTGPDQAKDNNQHLGLDRLALDDTALNNLILDALRKKADKDKNGVLDASEMVEYIKSLGLSALLNENQPGKGFSENQSQQVDPNDTLALLHLLAGAGLLDLVAPEAIESLVHTSHYGNANEDVPALALTAAVATSAVVA